MTRLIVLELHKLRTTPAAWVSLAVTVVLGAVSVASNALVPNPGGPPFGSTDQVNHALSVAALTSMVMLAIGIIMMAGEYRTRTIVSTYLATPRRGRVLAAKLVTAAGLGAILGATVFGMALLEAHIVYGTRGVESLPVDVTQLWVGATVSSALWGMLGVAVGAITRNTVAAILGTLAWALLVETGILATVAPDIAKWMPAGAALALTSVGSAGSALLSPVASAAVLTGWAIALSAVAARFTLSRESH
ncbi:ABC transporter permease [Monashia sp. NPDC004114]